MSEAVQQEPVWAFNHALELYRARAEFADLGPVLRRAREDIDELIEMSVQRAAQRETWETIGAALGVSRQAARKKFGPRS